MSGSVFITGCSRGIGLGLARIFATNDWRVIATARNIETPALHELAADHANISLLPLDVTSPESVNHAALQAAKLVPALDVLINNAAVFPGEGDEEFEALDLDWFGEAFDVNVTGVARVTRAVLPLLRASDNPRVVNISSGAGSISEKDDFSYYPYSVSKAALNMLSRAMAADLGRDNIIVVPISPGWVKTEMGGPNATLSVEESAASIFQAINRLAVEDAGCFLGRDGSRDDYYW